MYCYRTTQIIVDKELPSSRIRDMPNITSQHPDRQRRYYGEELAEQLLEFMRDDRPMQRRIAVQRALRFSPEAIGKLNAKIERGRSRVTELIHCLKSMFGEPLRGRVELPGKAGRAKEGVMHRCNRLLLRYRVRWLVGPISTEDGSQEEDNMQRPTYGFVELVAPGRNVTAQECHAVRAIMKLAEIGALQKLRTCKRCSLWFYARFSTSNSARRLAKSSTTPLLSSGRNTNATRLGSITTCTNPQSPRPVVISERTCHQD